MSEPKKPATKRIIDVAHPGKSAPSDTSRPVLISNRPILKDPMVVTEADPEKSEKLTPKTTQKVEPLGPPPLEKEKIETDHATKAAPNESKTSKPKPETTERPTGEASEANIADQPKEATEPEEP
ncbi:MAG TPA: hypothetical protein VK712_00785, partial [Verrucomicrobiae bacterium]|nr:hypothetical protein [Verrucomicrobiae bacterium]